MMEKRLSLEELGIFEGVRLVNTPRSLEACRREGIEPKDLLYRPLESFQEENEDSEVQALYYEFFEHKRRALVKAVRKTRKELMREEMGNHKSKSKSSSLTSGEFKFRENLKMSKDKQVHSIARILSHEANAIKQMSARHQEFLSGINNFQKNMKIRAKREKKKADKIRIVENERERVAAQKLKEEQKSVSEQMKSTSKGRNYEQIIREQKEKEKETAVMEKNAKIKEHLDKMEEHLARVRSEKEYRIQLKNDQEQRRQEKLRKMIHTSRIRIRAKSKNTEKRRIELLSKIEQETLMRKKSYEESAKLEIEKSSRFVEYEHAKIKEKLRSKSQERDKKINNAHQMTEEQLELKRIKLLQKYDEDEKRVKETQDFLKKEAEFRKHREVLKEFNKQWNLQRENKKAEYHKQVVSKRLEEEERRVKEIKKMKNSQSLRTLQLNHHQLQKKEILKDAVYKMSITNKWDKKYLNKILTSSKKHDSVQSILGSLSVPEAPSPLSH